MDCASPCSACYGNVHKCFSCLSSYAYDYDQLVCFKCIDLCKDCEFRNKCITCEDSYYNNRKSYLSCADRISDCSSCDYNKCLTCSS